MEIKTENTNTQKRKVGRPVLPEDQKKSYDNKLYYQHFKEKHKEKTHCECGGSFSYYSKFSHLRTKKHKLFFLQNENTKLKEQIINNNLENSK